MIVPPCGSSSFCRTIECCSPLAPLNVKICSQLRAHCSIVCLIGRFVFGFLVVQTHCALGSIVCLTKCDLLSRMSRAGKCIEFFVVALCTASIGEGEREKERKLFVRCLFCSCARLLSWLALLADIESQFHLMSYFVPLRSPRLEVWSKPSIWLSSPALALFPCGERTFICPSPDSS